MDALADLLIEFVEILLIAGIALPFIIIIGLIWRHTRDDILAKAKKEAAAAGDSEGSSSLGGRQGEDS